MQAIQRVGEPTFDRGDLRDNRVCVQFKLNMQPDETWVALFKAHAASSVLDGAHAVFNGRDVSIEAARPSTIAELATALDCFIECANLGLRSWGLPERTPTSSRRRFPNRV